MRSRFNRNYVSPFEALVGGELNIYGYSLFPRIIFQLFDAASYMNEGVRDGNGELIKGTKRRNPTNVIENAYLGQLLGGMQPILDIGKEIIGFGNMRYKSYKEHAARDVIILFRAGLNVLAAVSSILLMPLLVTLTVVNAVLYSLTELWQGNFSKAGNKLLNGLAMAAVNAVAYTLDGFCRLGLAITQTALTPFMFIKVPIYSAYTYYYGMRPIEEDTVIKEIADDIRILSKPENKELSNGFLPAKVGINTSFHDCLVRLSKQLSKAKLDGRDITTLDTLPESVKTFMENTQRESMSDILFYQHFLENHQDSVGFNNQGSLVLDSHDDQQELLTIANTLSPAAA